MKGESFDLTRQNSDAMKIINERMRVPQGFYIDSRGFLVPERSMDTNPKVIMSGSVGEQMFDRLSCNLTDIEKRPRSIESLEVVLSSFDGDIIYGFSIYNLLKQFGDINNVPIKITEYGATINPISALILQAADERCMFENQKMLFKPIAKQKGSGFLEEDQEEQESLTETYITIMEKRAQKVGKTEIGSIVRDLMEVEESITSEYAEHYCLVDKILRE